MYHTLHLVVITEMKLMLAQMAFYSASLQVSTVPSQH